MERLVVVDADPAWPQQFRRDRRRTSGRSSERRSCASNTWDRPSVPGSRRQADHRHRRGRGRRIAGARGPATIESAGYRWVGDLTSRAVRRSSRPTAPPLPVHHLYLVVENNRAHADHWLLRDALIDDPELDRSLRRDQARERGARRRRRRSLHRAEGRVRRRGPGRGPPNARDGRRSPTGNRTSTEASAITARRDTGAAQW